MGTKVEVKIPAKTNDTSYRNEGAYAVELTVQLTPSGNVKLLNHEFSLADLQEAIAILKQHSATRT